MKMLQHLEVPYSEAERDYTLSCLWCGSEDKFSVSAPVACSNSPTGSAVEVSCPVRPAHRRVAPARFAR